MLPNLSFLNADANSVVLPGELVDRIASTAGLPFFVKATLSLVDLRDEHRTKALLNLPEPEYSYAITNEARFVFTCTKPDGKALGSYFEPIVMKRVRRAVTQLVERHVKGKTRYFRKLASADLSLGKSDDSNLSLTVRLEGALKTLQSEAYQQYRRLMEACYDVWDDIEFLMKFPDNTGGRALLQQTTILSKWDHRYTIGYINPLNADTEFVWIISSVLPLLPEPRMLLLLEKNNTEKDDG